MIKSTVQMNPTLVSTTEWYFLFKVCQIFDKNDRKSYKMDDWCQKQLNFSRKAKNVAGLKIVCMKQKWINEMKICQHKLQTSYRTIIDSWNKRCRGKFKFKRDEISLWSWVKSQKKSPKMMFLKFWEKKNSEKKVKLHFKTSNFFIFVMTNLKKKTIFHKSQN